MSEEPKKYDRLTIYCFPRGGYCVREAWQVAGLLNSELFASTTIEEALKFIGEHLETTGRIA